MAQSILQSIWPTYLEPIINQLAQQSSVTLYAIPVVTVLAFCLLVFTFGFKTVTLPVDSVTQDEGKKGKSKPKSKQKPKQSSPSQNQVKANGSANHVNQQKQQQQQQPAKPKAVVQPLKRDKVTEKNKKNQAEKEPEVDVADLDSGEWVTVSSKKAIKNQEKLQARKKEGKVKDSPASAKENDKKASVTEEEISQIVENAWTLGGVEEDAIEFEDTRALKKKPSKKQKEKSSSKKQPEPESILEPQRLPDDKITSTVIANYDSVAEQKPKKKSDAKKGNKKAEKGTEVKVQAPEEALGSKLVAVDASPVLPELPSNKLSQPVVPPAPSSSTDITDATESDPSEGEFKVVRKRKARRE